MSTLHKVSCVSQKKDLAKVLCQIERQARKTQLNFNAKKQLKLATLARTHTLLRPRTHTHAFPYAFCINYAVVCGVGQRPKCMLSVYTVENNNQVQLEISIYFKCYTNSV